MHSVSELRAAGAALPHTQETFPFGATTLVFKVGGKMYALCDIASDDLSVSLKVRPERGDELRATYAAITPGYHLNKRHWVTLRLNGELPGTLVAGLLRGSYDLVWRSLTRAVRAELEGTEQ